MFWSQNVHQVLNYTMKHVLYFFDPRKGSRIDLSITGLDIYLEKLYLSVITEGVMFQKGHK